jgi:phosphopentomutase
LTALPKSGVLESDVLLLVADHGIDPTTPSTDTRGPGSALVYARSWGVSLGPVDLCRFGRDIGGDVHQPDTAIDRVNGTSFLGMIAS